MGWFKQLCLSSIIIISGVIACVSGQELTNTLREGNRICPGDEVNFTCTIRGLSGMSVFVLGWSSDEYIGQGGSLQLSTIEMIGEIKTSTSMDGNITATATLTNNTNVNGDRVLESTLHITATVASTVTCSNSGTGGTGSIEFSISVIPDAPRNVRAAQVSQENGNNCIILVTWDPPTNIDESDIDHYIITVPSRNIVETESFAITALRIRNCHRNDSIQVAAVNRFECVGEDSLQTRPSLLGSIARTTESNTGTPIGSTTDTGTSIGSTTVTPIASTSASVSAIAAAGVAAVLFIVLCFVLVVLVLFVIHYKRGKKMQASWQVLSPDVLRLEEHVEAETKLIDDLQNRLQDTSVKRNLEELYNALKLKLPSRKMQAAARDLRATLMLGMESSRFNENVKEAFISCLEALQLENDEVVKRVIENMDSIITGMTGVDEEFKDSVRLLRTKVGTGEHKEVLGDLIKKVEKDEPSDIMIILLSLCGKLRNVRQVKDYYCKQSKHDISDLGTGEDRVSVPIWMDDKLDDSWKAGLLEAVQAINEAAPGLSLLITEDREQAIIHVLAIDKKDSETYTEVEGNILLRSKGKKFITEIRLGKWKDDGKKGVCIHELFHALGFHHEHQDAIADSKYECCLDSGKKIPIDKNELRFIWWESSTTTLYPCESKCRGHSEDHVCKWVLKAYPAKANTDLDEHDMVGLNLVYPPFVDKTASNTGYRPKLGRNGVYYCGREVMTGLTFPGEEYDHLCGPNKGPNCPACRTIKSPKVEKILKKEKWQGMTGRVYCGRPFIKPGELFRTHDGICGMDNGPACDDCNDILNKEHVQSASRPHTSVQ